MYQNLKQQLMQANQAEKSAARLFRRNSPSVIAPALKSRTFGTIVHQRSLEPSGSRKKQIAPVGAGLTQSTSEEILKKRNSAGVLNSVQKSNSKERQSFVARLGSTQLLQNQFQAKSRAAIAEQKSMFSQTQSTAKSHNFLNTGGASGAAALTAKKNVHSLLQQSTYSGSKNSDSRSNLQKSAEHMSVHKAYPGICFDQQVSQQSFGQKTPMKACTEPSIHCTSSQPFADVSNQFQQRTLPTETEDHGTPTVGVNASQSFSHHESMNDLKHSSSKRHRISQRAQKENEMPHGPEPSAVLSSTRSQQQKLPSNQQSQDKQPASRLTSTLTSLPATRTISNASRMQMPQDASLYPYDDKAAQDDQSMIDNGNNNHSHQSGASHVSSDVQMFENQDNGQFEGVDQKDFDECLEVIDQSSNEAGAGMVENDFQHDGNFMMPTNPTVIHGTSTEYVYGDQEVNENGIYGDESAPVEEEEVIEHDEIDVQDMEAYNQAMQLTDKHEQLPMPLEEFYKMQKIHGMQEYQQATSAAYGSAALDTALPTEAREPDEFHQTDTFDKQQQEIINEEVDRLLQQQATPESNDYYTANMNGTISRSAMPSNSTRSFKGIGQAFQTGMHDSEQFSTGQMINGGYTIQQNANGCCYIQQSNNFIDDGAIHELNEEDLVSSERYQARNFTNTQDQDNSYQYGAPSSQRSRQQLNTIDHQPHRTINYSQNMINDSLPSHTASGQGLARHGNSHLSRGSQFVDIQSPLTYLSKDKRSSDASKWNQPVLRQKYQRGMPGGISRGSRVSANSSRLGHGSSAGRLPTMPQDVFTVDRTSRSKPEMNALKGRVSNRPAWRREPRSNTGAPAASSVSQSKPKSTRREISKPAWGARQQPQPYMQKTKSTSMLQLQARQSSAETCNFATALQGTPEQEIPIPATGLSSARDVPEPSRATPAPITLNFTANPSTAKQTPHHQIAEANFLLDQPPLHTQQTASTNQILGLTPGPVGRRPDQIGGMPLFIDQLQLTQRSAINSNDEEAANSLFNPPQTKTRLSTTYSSRLKQERDVGDANSDDCTSQGKKRRVSRLERQLHSAEKKASGCFADRPASQVRSRKTALELDRRPQGEDAVSSRSHLDSASQHLQDLLEAKQTKLNNYLTDQQPERKNDFLLSLEQNFERQKKHCEMMDESYQMMQENDKLLAQMEQEVEAKDEVYDQIGNDALSQDILAAQSLKHKRVTSKQLRRQLTGSFSSSFLLGQSGKKRTGSLTSVGQLKRIESKHAYRDESADQQSKGGINHRTQDSDLYTFHSPQLLGGPQQKSTSSLISRKKTNNHDSIQHQLSYSKSAMINAPRTVGQSRQQSTIKKRDAWMFGGGHTSRSRLRPKKNNMICHSQTSLGSTTGLGRKRSAASFDPQKRSIIKEHMSHKGRVTNLQAEVCEQKQIIRRHLTEKLQKLRTMVIQTQKRAELAANENALLKEQLKSLRITADRQQLKNADVARHIQHTQGEINDIEHDCADFENYKVQLAAELRQEMRFKADIQKIASKYKRLIADQRRDKERIAQGLVQQRKIMANSKRRRDTLLDDNNKIYDDFARVVRYDKQRQDEISKRCQVKLSQQDQQVLKC